MAWFFTVVISVSCCCRRSRRCCRGESLHATRSVIALLEVCCRSSLLPLPSFCHCCRGRAKLVEPLSNDTLRPRSRDLLLLQSSSDVRRGGAACDRQKEEEEDFELVLKHPYSWACRVEGWTL